MYSLQELYIPTSASHNGILYTIHVCRLYYVGSIGHCKLPGKLNLFPTLVCICTCVWACVCASLTSVCLYKATGVCRHVSLCIFASNSAIPFVITCLSDKRKIVNAKSTFDSARPLGGEFVNYEELLRKRLF